MSSKKNNDSTWGCIVELMILIFLMPFVGLYLYFRPEDDAKTVGTILVVVGVIIWIIIGTNK